MRRRFRKHPQQHADPSQELHDPLGNRPRPIRVGYLWMGFALVILVLVIGYDRRAVGEAREHILSGKSYEKEGLYHEAVDEYESALKNKRLGRRERASVALALADLQFERFQDYPQAHRHYVQARQISPSIVESKELQRKIRVAQERANRPGATSVVTTVSGGGTKDKVTTRTVVQQVELVRPPASDDEGPALVTFRGGEVRAGEVLRALEKRPEFQDPSFRESPEKLKGFLENYLQQALAYQAGLEEGMARDPEVSERLFNYQKSIIAERFLVGRREEALTISNASVERYYQENIGNFRSPAKASIAFIKCDNETSATEALAALGTSTSFKDVASSYSIDRETAERGGVAGIITTNDTAIPGVGEAPEIVKSLLSLPANAVTSVVQVGGGWYVFTITNSQPEKHVTLEQARPGIEQFLKGQAVDKVKYGVAQDLNERFTPSISDENIEKFWQFATAKTSPADGLSTSTETTTNSATATGTLSTSAPAEGAARI